VNRLKVTICQKPFNIAVWIGKIGEDSKLNIGSASEKHHSVTFNLPNNHATCFCHALMTRLSSSGVV
jgi:hypothetical protein